MVQLGTDGKIGTNGPGVRDAWSGIGILSILFMAGMMPMLDISSITPMLSIEFMTQTALDNFYYGSENNLEISFQRFL